VKSGSNTVITALPDEPPGGVSAGLDWARDDHAVSAVEARGREVVRHGVEHCAAGLRELIDVLTDAGARQIAIERPAGPVVDALLSAGLTVVVISPNQVENLRGRHGSAGNSAGNSDDRFDAFVLADTVRTDRARLRPLTPDSPDSPVTINLRRACRARKDLVTHRVGMANQLRAHLHNAFPAAVDRFAEIDSPISLTFLTRFDHQDRADWPSAADLYNRARARGPDHPHPARILARAWLYVIWHCWQHNTAYNPTRHRALQRLLQDQPVPA
jgi:transposase